MKIAIVHDWLVTYAGAERVLGEILKIYPSAELFAVVDFLPEDQRFFIQNKKVKTTFIQKLPFAKSKYRYYLPLMPLAIEQINLSGYDIVISSSHAVAKGVITGPDQLHISYVHSPMRYVWDLQHQYLKESMLDKGLKSWIARWLLHKIRIWDVRTANNVDVFVANSKYIARRIKKTYRRDAVVIYPPVDISKFPLRVDKENFYLTASRMVPYKRIELIVEAFVKMPDKKLVVIGDGPCFNKVKKIVENSKSKNITLLGYQPFEILRDFMQRAKAFVFAAEEDFGIVMVEAQACGTPVIAFGKGGASEIIKGLNDESPTGVFFMEQTHEALINAIKLFENNEKNIDPYSCRENALRFSPERFRKEFKMLVEGKYFEYLNS